MEDTEGKRGGTTSTHSYIDPLTNPVVLAKLLENIFINLFIHTLCHSSQLPYLCIWDFSHSPDTQQTSEVVNLYSPNPRSPLLPPYHYLATYVRTGTSSD